MSASAALIARLRLMIAEPSDTAPYTDEELAAVIERYPMMDERGVYPYFFDTSTDPPTQVAVMGWYPTYDLAAAAEEVWAAKAAALADDVDMPHVQQVIQYGTEYENAMKQARYWGARKAAGTITLHPAPSPNRYGRGLYFNQESEE